MLLVNVRFSCQGSLSRTTKPVNKIKCRIRNGVTRIEGGADRLHEISQSKCTGQASRILWICLQGSRMISFFVIIITSRRCSLHQVAFGLKQRLCTGCLVLSWHLSHDSRARRAAWALPCSLVSRALLCSGLFVGDLCAFKTSGCHLGICIPQPQMGRGWGTCDLNILQGQHILSLVSLQWKSPGPGRAFRWWFIGGIYHYPYLQIWN